MLTGGQVAGLIVAVFRAILVCFLAYVLIQLGKVLAEATRLVSGLSEQSVPLLGQVTTSVVHVNAELERVDSIPANVQSVTGVRRRGEVKSRVKAAMKADRTAARGGRRGSSSVG